MRVLFCSTGGVGHIQPMRPLALALRRQGHAVGWVTAPDALASLGGQGLALFAAGLGFEASRRQFLEHHPVVRGLIGERLSEQTFPRLFGGTLAPAMLAEIGAAIDRWQPDAVVLEPAALAAPLACTLRGVRYAIHAYGLPVPAAYLASAMRWFAPHWEAQGLAAPADGGLARGLALEIAPPSLLGAAAPASAGRLNLNPYGAAGIAPADRSAELPGHLRAALERRGRPRVYLTFGTVFNHRPTLADAARALVALGAELVVTTGAGGDGDAAGGAGRFGNAPHLHVFDFVDQAALLPYCDFVVSHGGAGTVLGAAARGLPQLLLPQGADHFRNARALARAGAGLVVEPAEQSVAGIRRAAEQLWTSPAHAQAARRLAAEMALMPDAEHAAQAFVRHFSEREARRQG